MAKFKDISGQKFGRLTALYRLHNHNKNKKYYGSYWLCVCECGNLTEVYLGSLQSGASTSCGCLVKKHGKSHNPLYRNWLCMKTRCYNKTDEHYKDYGGRGIKVCDEWLKNFQAFYDWSMKHEYKKGLTLDRININGDYEPSNCRWATSKQQARNRRSNRNVTIKGETRCLSEWCEILNLNYNTICTRINKLKWDIYKALEVK